MAWSNSKVKVFVEVIVNIQEAAAASGLTPDTIRFYERQGVLPGPPRQANGYRNYTTDHVRILRLAKGMRDLAVPLDELRPVIGVAHSGTCGEVRQDLIQTLSHALSETEHRLAELLYVRDHVSLVLEALESMHPADEMVPGMELCECVQLINEAG